MNRAFLLGAVLGALASLAPACGPAKMPCNSTTCSGCCDSTGFCQFGFDNQGCGTSGNSCQVCGLGTACQTGLCLPTNSGNGGGAGGGSGGGTGGGTGGGAVGGGSGGGGCVGITCPTGGGAGGGVIGGGTGGGVTGGGTGGGGTGGGVTGGGTGGGVTGGGTGGGVTGGGTGGGVTGGGAGGGTGGGGALPSFTSQLWYLGRVTQTTRNELGRVLFPSRTLAPLTVPGTDIRGWSVNVAGRLIALSADTTVAGRFDLVVVNHDGTGLRTVVPAPTGTSIGFPKFSPNGQRIAFETRDASTLQRIYAVSTAGGTPIEITPTRTNPTDTTLNIINTTWSRDSRYLAIVAETTVDRLNELWIVDFNQPTPAPVNIVPFSISGSPGAGTGFWGVVSPVEWSSAARNELVFKFRSTVVGAGAFRLMQISTLGTNFGPVPGSPDGINMGGWIGSFGIAADGVTVAYSADSVTTNAYELYRTSMLSGPATLLTSGAVATGTRPDFVRPLTFNSTGTSFAFGANYTAGALMFEPYLMPMPNGPPLRLAALTTGGTVDDTVWSPDGSQLAIVSDWRTDETYELALISSLTSLSTPTPLVTPVAGGDVLDVQWTP